MAKAPAETVLEILARETGISRGEIETDKELVGDLGIDSPRTLQILVAIEDEFDIEVTDEELADLKTVGDILAVIEDRFPVDSA